LAAEERPFAPLVRAAFFAAAERNVAERFNAARLACADSDLRDAERLPSFRNAFNVTLARLGDDAPWRAARFRCDADLFALVLLRKALF